ncbi:MAG: hypothetical protein AMDU5_GPLC00017G0033 [Thermoplasmatales archaeon Gpl]|nr:MAG: hypothetical protein AMDU5_GPLC00017G0033 [Thermoplasmatales archaeon Gpl]
MWLSVAESLESAGSNSVHSRVQSRKAQEVKATSRQLVEMMERSRSLKAAKNAIKERFGVEYSYRQIIRISKQIEQENLDRVE